MKKLSLLLACLLVLALVSCTSEEKKISAPTSSASHAPTDAQTEGKSEQPTDAPTETVTGAPTDDAPISPTDAPTETVTDAPTDGASISPTEAPTEAVTGAPTGEPTDAPTHTPTDEATSSPTEVFSLIFEKDGDGYSVVGYKGTVDTLFIPESYEGLPVVSIGESALEGMKELQSVILPSSLSVIGRAAFRECTGLQSVTLPANLTAIEDNAFHRCSAISAVTYGGKAEAFQKITVGIRNQTLTKAAFTYLNQPSIHDEPEEVLDKIYTIIEPKTMTLSNGDVFNYRMYVPENYDATKAYPLLILLHGAGERGDDNALQMKNMVATLFADEDSPIQDAIFLCPQCPKDNQWVDTPWANGNYSTDDVPVSNEIQGVLEMLASVRESHNVDESRIYIMGISMGGFGTWDLILRNPDLFAAAIPICGGGDPDKASSVAHLPIRTFHGDADTVVPVDGTRAMVDALRAVGGNIEYEELAGYGHNVWDYVAEKEGLMDWLFTQRKGETDIEVNIGDLMGQ